MTTASSSGGPLAVEGARTRFSRQQPYAISSAKMMRYCIVFALALAAASANVMPRNNLSGARTADMDFLLKQKKILDLFMYIDQNVLSDHEYFELGRNYDIYANIDYYNDKEIVTEFLNIYKLGMLKKDAIFTMYKPEHRDEVMLLYRLFYFAKDFNTFYKTACWARLNLNPMMFTIAFSTAVLYRDDTKYIRVPAIYEIYPNLFFDSKVIREAQYVKMTRGYGYDTNRGLGMLKHHELDTAAETFYVYSNYTDVCLNPMYENEYRLTYFMEDVDLNAYYYYFRMMFPFWIDTKDYNVPKNIRGDLYYFLHKQIMSRYYLERLSRGLGSIEDFTWDRMNLPGYYSDLSFSNGVSLPQRDWWNVVPFYKLHYIDHIKKVELRIMEAIDLGFVIDYQGKQISIYTPEGLNILGNIIEGNRDSVNWKYYGAYDVLGRNILGQNFDSKAKDFYVPSTLQLFSTSLRDPAFYRFYDRIMFFFQRYKYLLNRYTKNELEFPGVRIENVEVDKFVTFWDKKEYLINNAVAVDSYKEGRAFNIKAYQRILNYKQFNYKFSINCDRDTKAVVRIFLGPAVEGDKYDDYSYFQYYYRYFFMLDEFEYMLKPGMNSFDRSCMDTPFFKHEYLTGDLYYRKIAKAIEGNEPFTFNERIFGFPNHLMLPSGTVDGMRYKLFVYVGPYEEAKTYELPYLGNIKYYGKSFGFPLDRPANPWFFKLDNTYFKDVFIYNMKDFETTINRNYY